MATFEKDLQYVKFCAYGFLKNLRFFDAFLLLYFLESGISYSQIGLLYAARELTINITEIPTGIVADTYGRKSSLIAAFLCYIISFVLFYLAPSLLWLMLGMVLMGISDAFRSGTHKGMIMDYLKIKGWSDQKINYYGHTRSWSHRGSAVSAIVAGVFVFYAGSYRLIYLISILPYLLNFLNVLSYPTELNYASKKKKKKGGTIIDQIKNFFLSLRNREVLKIIHSASLHGAFLKAVKDYIQPVLVQVSLMIPILLSVEEKNKSGLVIGIVYFFIYILSAWVSSSASSFYSGGKGDKVQLTLLIGLLGGGLSGLFLQQEWWIFALLGFTLIFLVENLRKPILTGMLADQVEPGILTSVISAQNFYKTILTSLLAIGMGVMADRCGIGISLTLTSFAFILITLLIGRPKRMTPTQARS
ncbi:MAG: MFS transporter [Bacteroidota bacterium]